LKRWERGQTGAPTLSAAEPGRRPRAAIEKARSPGGIVPAQPVTEHHQDQRAEGRENGAMPATISYESPSRSLAERACKR
jgi:hypothetical protein